MIVGPTVLIVSIGTGAPARIDSSNQMNCSTALKPRPPYSLGQPTPSQPSAPIWRTTLRCSGPTPSGAGELRPHLGREQLLVVVADLELEPLLLVGEPMYIPSPPVGLTRRPGWAARALRRREHVTGQRACSAKTRQTSPISSDSPVRIPAV